MTYNTTIGRTVLAMLLGALVGGNLSMGLLIAAFGPPTLEQAPQVWLMMQLYWLGGLIIFALIPFGLFYYAKLRQWYVMTMLGVMTMVMLSFYTFKGVDSTATMAALAAIGGLVGWVIWRVAYRPAAITGDDK